MIKPLENERDRLDAEFGITKKPKISSVLVSLPEGNYVILTEKEWDKQTEDYCKKRDYKVNNLKGE